MTSHLKYIKRSVKTIRFLQSHYGTTSQPNIVKSSKYNYREGLIVACGNPLLDISAVVDESLLEKYDLKPNNAILCEEKHKTLKDDLIEKYKAEFIAGGSAQNSSRILQWIVKKPNVVTYFGSVGKDNFAQILEKKAKDSGVNPKYQYVSDHPTGTCAVLITGNNRSLVADLAAANHFTLDHIQKEENMKLIKQADYFYITSFFLTVSPSSIMEIAQYAHENHKPFIMNLSASFLSMHFKEPMMKVFPYVDIIFGNDEEALTFAKEQNFNSTDMKEIAVKISNFNLLDSENPRVVVITCGPCPVIYAKGKEVIEIEALPVNPSEIIDTNGAGDAFAGGFLAYYIQKYPMIDCVKAGIKAATHILKNPGCTYSKDFPCNE